MNNLMQINSASISTGTKEDQIWFLSLPNLIKPLEAQSARNGAIVVADGLKNGSPTGIHFTPLLAGSTVGVTSF